MLARLRHKDPSDDFDMQLIGTFLSFASRGDRVGLNQMLREGTSPNVQDYDKRTALHLAASEGHASIVELLLHYSANVNLEDRWQKTVSIYFGFESLTIPNFFSISNLYGVIFPSFFTNVFDGENLYFVASVYESI